MNKKNVQKQASQADDLKKKLKQSSFVEGDINLRLHRAISWMKASEENNLNEDIKFICLWISFNSCYAIDNFNDFKDKKSAYEKNNINSFFTKLISFDNSRKIYALLWNRFSSEVRLILENEFLFEPFWDYHRGEKINYKLELDRSIEKANNSLASGDVASVLEIVLRRLYVLRNQVFHGGATYKSSVNRKQVKDGSMVLYRLLPIVIEIMTEHKEESWGLAYYPVVNRP